MLRKGQGPGGWCAGGRVVRTAHRAFATGGDRLALAQNVARGQGCLMGSDQCRRQRAGRGSTDLRARWGQVVRSVRSSVSNLGFDLQLVCLVEWRSTP